MVSIKSASDFADALTGAFAHESSKARFSEVQLFRALMNSFSCMRSGFHVEEYHGAKHQVFFIGNGDWGRSPARCELCDLVFVAYRPKPVWQCRVTFLQAKLSKQKYPVLCRGYPARPTSIDFQANLEQWDLLSSRPAILGVPPFRIPPLLLQEAELASVGSFGIFHRSQARSVQFLYSSADVLSVVGSPKTKHGRLALTPVPRMSRTTNGYRETVFCCCLGTFAESLYSLEIGTPVRSAASAAEPSALTHWLGELMQSYLMEHQDSEMAREILSGLGLIDQAADRLQPMPLPSIVIVKADTEAGHAGIGRERPPEVFETPQ